MFYADWSAYCAKFSSQVPGLQNLALDSALRTTNASFTQEYCFEYELGRGTSGTVYRVHHVVHPLVYAVKQYHNPDAVRFEEVKSMQHISHVSLMNIS